MVVINMGEPRKWPWLEQKAAYSSQHWPTLTLTKKQLPLSKNMTLLLCLEKGKKKSHCITVLMHLTVSILKKESTEFK